MNEPHHRLDAAHGYIDLGMFEEAWDELESLPPDLRADDVVFEMRLEIFQRMQKWESARILAESLAKRSPENPGWWLAWSDSIRREQSVEAASEVLRQAAMIHPTVAIITYKLACYSCVLGDVAEARDLLAKAIELDDSFKMIALDDPDLDAIFGPGKADTTTKP